jgi:hypothetical protein
MPRPHEQVPGLPTMPWLRRPAQLTGGSKRSNAPGGIAAGSRPGQSTTEKGHNRLHGYRCGRASQLAELIRVLDLRICR